VDGVNVSGADVGELADVVVMGLGPGGEEVAERLAEAGLDVVGIDGGLVGGECPYWGCVPSKMMIRAGNLLAEGRRIPGMAGSSVVISDWDPVADRIRDEATDDWDDTVAVERFEGKGGRFVRGWARLDGPGRVTVTGTSFEARTAIVVATGTRPWAPPVPGLAGTPYWTNRDAIECKELPASLAVLGGGAIGVELAQVFARFGVKVTIVEAAERLVALEEPESSQLVAEALQADGVEVFTGCRIDGVAHDAGKFTVSWGGREGVTADRLLVATGRRPDLAAIGIDSVGLDPESPWLPVDDHLRVTRGLWAVGDVTGKGAFTHVAMYQAGIAVSDILRAAGVSADAGDGNGDGDGVGVGDGIGDGADYRALPRVTFTDPEVGAVGMTVAQAETAGVRVKVGRAEIPASSRGWIHKAGNRGFITLVEDADRGVLVGATSAGPVGGEVLGMLTLAVHAGVSTVELRRMIYAYPTFHRAVEAALADLDG
jgi:pyruvate/2-oxoglutarate dehydrogenase complex dihydrolipoamide dehydrogenase (E3) component